VGAVLALLSWGFSMPVIPKWCLFAVALLFVIYGVLAWAPYIRYWSIGWRVVAGLFIVVGLALIFWSEISRENMEEKSRVIEGMLRPQSTLNYPPKLDVELGEKGAHLLIGPTTDVLHLSPRLKILYDSGFKIEQLNNRLYVTTPVRDKQGRLVANIVRNRWSVTSECLDKNFDKDSLEILDTRGLVVLYVKVFSDHVQIEGEWRDEFGHGIRLRKGTESYMNFWQNSVQEEEGMEIIKPKFKYPSSLHLGEREDVN
jgi:hypothetical protein